MFILDIYILITQISVDVIYYAILNTIFMVHFDETGYQIYKNNTYMSKYAPFFADEKMNAMFTYTKS